MTITLLHSPPRYQREPNRLTMTLRRVFLQYREAAL